MIGRSKLSITARLSLAFGAVSVLLSGGIGIYLYRALDEQLMQRHRDEIATKVVLLRHAISELAAASDIAAAIRRIPDTLSPPERTHVRLLGADGRVLFASDSVEVPAELLADSAPLGNIPTEYKLWRGPTGATYLTASAFAQLGEPERQRVLISVTLDVREEHDEARSRFRTRLFLTLAAGAMLAALLGLLVANRGLRPVRRFADSAARITSKRLHKRLDEQDVPAELAQLAFAFNGMLARLEESFGYLEDFSSDLAHELRTPINNLMGQTEVALSATRTVEQYREILQSNLEQCGRISRMISDMLFLANAGQPQFSLKREEVDARAEIGKVLEFYEALLDNRGLRVSLRGEATVSADRTLLQRAITNLLSNAVRYTLRGECIEITISREAGGGVSIEVANPGPGIPAEHLPRIFDRFYRIDTAREHSQESTGLGLAIVKSIMRLHGGEVTVTSRPGDLTRFRLVFP